MPKKPPVPALENTDITNLPGERWKDVPGFEGRYQLSNYGRTKSLKRQIKLKQHHRLSESRILLPHIIKSKTKKTKPEIKGLQVELWKNKRYNVSVARNVYNLFCKSFDVADRSLVIRHKDGDRLNCHYNNLELISHSQFLKEAYQAGSRVNVLQANARPVVQYTAEGKFIAAYASAREASVATGINSRYINTAAATKTRKAFNFYWRYGKPQTRIRVSDLQ